jgi:hypothetical protein
MPNLALTVGDAVAAVIRLGCGPRRQSNRVLSRGCTDIAIDLGGGQGTRWTAEREELLRVLVRVP